MAKRRMGIIAFLLCLCFFAAPISVNAASTVDATEPIFVEKKCSLTVSLRREGVSFSNVLIKVYKLADVSVDFQYTPTSTFSSAGITLNGIKTVSEWNVVRSTVEAYVLSNDVEPSVSSRTDVDGNAFFDSVDVGLYFVLGVTACENGKSYRFDSSLVALPNLDSDGVWKYQTVVKAKSEIVPPEEKTEYKVLKLWRGDKASNRPESVEVEIYRDGNHYKTVVLSAENNWSFGWSEKSDGSIWTVYERGVPEGYTMSVEKRDACFVITNTYSGDESQPPDTPTTGDTSNTFLYLFLMIISGVILVAIGLARKGERV